MTEKAYVVNGMTCGHCVQAVTDELMNIEGVDVVNVDLTTGRVTVVGEDVADDQVRAAVDEAGYALVE